MVLLGGNLQPANRYSDNFDAQYIEVVEYCGNLITQNRLEEAWILMSSLKQESIPLLLNKGLCLFEINRHEDCLQACEKILALSGNTKSNFPPEIQKEVHTLHNIQKNRATHLMPVTFRYVELFPEILRDSVLRLTIDCWSELKNKAQILKLGTPLLRKGYRNVTEAFQKINENTCLKND